jgi:hypothetical protein
MRKLRKLGENKGRLKENSPNYVNNEGKAIGH